LNNIVNRQIKTFTVKVNIRPEIKTNNMSPVHVLPTFTY
jgi:hypothetical protein